MSNVYYNPKDFGLEQIGLIEDDEPYQFDMIVLWRDTAGVLWWGHDSGCSCPSPFEDYTRKEDLSQLRAGEMDAFIAEVETFRGATLSERAELILTAKNALTGAQQ